MDTPNGSRSETSGNDPSRYFTARTLLVGLAAAESALLLTLVVWILSLGGWIVPLVFAVAVALLCILAYQGWKRLIVFFRRRCQYGLRALLLIVLMISVALAGLRLLMNREAARARRQQMAVGKLREFNPASCGYQPRPVLSILPASVLRRSEGIIDQERDLDFIGSVTLVDLSKTTATDEDLACLRDLPDVKYLDLSGTRVTDAGLRHLEGLSRLQYLFVKNTRVTDDGIRTLRAALAQHVWIER